MEIKDDRSAAKVEWLKVGLTHRMWRDSARSAEKVLEECGFADADDTRRVADKYGKRVA